MIFYFQPDGDAEMAEIVLQLPGGACFGSSQAVPGAEQQFPFLEAEAVRKSVKKRWSTRISPGRRRREVAGVRPRFSRTFLAASSLEPVSNGPAFPAAVKTPGQNPRSFFNEYSRLPLLSRENCMELAVFMQLRPEFFHFFYFSRFVTEKQKEQERSQ